MLKCLLTIVASFATAFCSPIAAQGAFEALCNFDSIRSKTGGRTDPTPVPQVAGLTFRPFQAVAPYGNPYHLSDNPTASKMFAFTGWPAYDADREETAEMAAGQYYEWRIVPQPGCEYRVDRIRFKLSRTSTGPTRYAVRTSVDGFSAHLPVTLEKANENVSFGPAGEIILADRDNEYTCRLEATLDAALASELSIRFYAWRAEVQTAPFKLDDVTVTGSVETLGSGGGQTPDTLAVGPDDLSFPTRAADIWRTDVTFPESPAPFSWSLQLLRQSFDAAAVLFNRSDTLPLRLQEVSVDVYAADTSQSASSQVTCDTSQVTCDFHIQRLLQTEIPPLSQGVERLRIIPLWRLTDSAAFTVKGVLRYTDPYDGAARTTVLYPACVSLAPTPWLQTAAFVPAEGGLPAVLQVTNRSDVPSDGIAWTYGWSGAVPDTLTVSSLPPGAMCRLFSAPLPDSLSAASSVSAREQGPYSPDPALWPAPSMHRLLHLVSLYTGQRDTLTDCLAEDDLDGECVYGSEGERLPVATADTLLCETRLLPARDSVAYFTLNPAGADGWRHARTSLPPSMRPRLLRSWQRLPALTDLASTSDLASDDKLCSEKDLPSENAWIDRQGRFHLVDTLAADSIIRFRVCLSLLDLAPVVTEIADSICLGDAYSGHGFNLPAFDEAGDYLLTDSLVAESGADSLVLLHLNVCTQPSVPGAVMGDSIIVRAGNYFYTVSPVPEASFYIWSVFPSDWTVTGSGETVSLNVPYTGKGVLTVRAVNRCGESQPAQLQLTTEAPLSSFTVYPDGADDVFVLETDGLEGTMLIAVSDLSGRVLYSVEKTFDADDRTARFSLSGQPSGLYMITIVSRNGTSAQKLLRP